MELLKELTDPKVLKGVALGVGATWALQKLMAQTPPKPAAKVGLLSFKFTSSASLSINAFRGIRFLLCRVWLPWAQTRERSRHSTSGRWSLPPRSWVSHRDDAPLSL